MSFGDTLPDGTRVKIIVTDDPMEIIWWPGGVRTRLHGWAQTVKYDGDGHWTREVYVPKPSPDTE